MNNNSLHLGILTKTNQIHGFFYSLWTSSGVHYKKTRTKIVEKRQERLYNVINAAEIMCTGFTLMDEQMDSVKCQNLA